MHIDFTPEQEALRHELAADATVPAEGRASAVVASTTPTSATSASAMPPFTFIRCPPCGV